MKTVRQLKKVRRNLMAIVDSDKGRMGPKPVSHRLAVESLGIVNDTLLSIFLKDGAN